MRAPVLDDSLEFGLNVLLLDRTDANVLEILFVLKDRPLHEASQLKQRVRHVKRVAPASILHSLPVSWQHRRVCHGLEQRENLGEVVDRLLELEVRVPLFERLGQLLRAVAKVQQLHVDRFGIHIDPLDVVEPGNALDHVVVESVKLAEQIELFLDPDQVKILCLWQTKDLLAR